MKDEKHRDILRDIARRECDRAQDKVMALSRETAARVNASLARRIVADALRRPPIRPSD